MACFAGKSSDHWMAYRDALGRKRIPWDKILHEAVSPSKRISHIIFRYLRISTSLSIEKLRAEAWVFGPRESVDFVDWMKAIGSLHFLPDKEKFIEMAIPMMTTLSLTNGVTYSLPPGPPQHYNCKCTIIAFKQPPPQL